MNEKHYMISDAAKMVDVESHVLRYWEEELKIDIPRNEMGHRYYTDTYIQLFREIKSLKEQGFLLKAIKTLLPELMEGKSFSNLDTHEISEAMNMDIQEDSQDKPAAPLKEQETVVSGEDKIEQFRVILGGIVSQAIEDNNEVLGKEVSSRVSDSVIKEMDYLLRLKEEREEERYKKFDEVLRNYQRGGREVAASVEKKGIFGHFRKKNNR
ncbi:MAG: MerR family transcriptional regulator [Lachnospiraceae bacterium]|nr:MerR family transcriptional regulator [Lachnospiraceae bacterium]